MTADSRLLLHHFDASPFAEKIRLVFGLKNLSWCSVEIPMVMPKPRLTALTGGYRKTPVLQIGADIYCDTQLIALELEQRFPNPSLFPDGEVISPLLSAWADEHFFRPGAALSMGTNPDIPEQVLDDRREFFSFLDFDRLHEQIPQHFAQFQRQLCALDQALCNDKAFLLGDRPGWADVLAYFPLWMARGNIAAISELVDGLELLKAWELKMQEIGHGERTEVTDETALDVARNSAPQATAFRGEKVWPGDLLLGSPVSVTPLDYGAVPVEGQLHRLTQNEICLLRKDDLAGELAVHFPRNGYELRAI